ncbi:MAG TPA: hypothetical protein VFI31_09675, partial [Pirellulales bacterium]|nr:hypothetical protein [Pirellulales bacterium]
MKLKWNLIRPRYSLRVMLVCLVLLTIFVARHREALRDRLEVLWIGKPVNHILIVGPQTIGAPAAIAPPGPVEIAAALERAGKVNR